MPPPPVGMQTGHYSPPPLAPDVPPPPGYENSLAGNSPPPGVEHPPGAHPLPGVGGTPSPENGFEKQSF